MSNAGSWEGCDVGSASPRCLSSSILRGRWGRCGSTRTSAASHGFRPLSSRAALFDAAVTLLLGLLFVAVGRRRASVAPWVALMAAGLVVAVVVERAGMAAGRWAYTRDMPMLPGVRLGILPIMQMVIIPAVMAWFILRRRSTRPRPGPDPSQRST